MLHDLDMARALEASINQFFATAQDGSLLFIQCDPTASSLRCIEHTKYILELGRRKGKEGRALESKEEAKQPSPASPALMPEVDVPSEETRRPDEVGG